MDIAHLIAEDAGDWVRLGIGMVLGHGLTLTYLSVKQHYRARRQRLQGRERPLDFTRAGKA